LATIYCDCEPGTDNTGDNGVLNNLLHGILGNTKDSEADLTEALEEITYRLEVMDETNEYLIHIGISEPNGQDCQKVNTEKIPDDVRWNQRWVEIKRYFSNAGRILFPYDPYVSPFYKGCDYFLLALYTSSLGMDRIQERLNYLGDMAKKEIVLMKDQLKNDPEIVHKRQKVVATYGIRDCSPVRQQERSLGIPINAREDWH
jgi:hypothetical protein